MQSYELINWFIVCLGVLSLWKIRGGVLGRYSWFYAITLLGIVFKVPVATLESIGYSVREMYTPPEAAETFFLAVAFDLVAKFAGLAFVELVIARKLLKAQFPVVKIDRQTLMTAMLFYSFGAVFIQIALQLSGYSGYFRSPEINYAPPGWLDPLQKLLGIGSGLYFIALIISQQEERKKSTLIVLASFWIVSGFLSGYKIGVFLPVALYAVASWLTGRFKWSYVAYSAVAIVVAYSVIEPLRSYRSATGEVSVADAFDALGNNSDVGMFTVRETARRLLLRVDSTDVSIAALHVDALRGLSEFRMRQNEMYEHWFSMAFVPRAFWPEKPLANLGSVLSYDLRGFRGNSLTIYGQASSYILGGMPAVVGFGFVNGVLLAVASILVSIWVRRPIELFPLFLLATAMSFQSDIELYYLIAVTRAYLAYLLFIWVGRLLGIIFLSRLTPPSGRRGYVHPHAARGGGMRYE